MMTLEVLKIDISVKFCKVKWSLSYVAILACLVFGVHDIDISIKFLFLVLTWD